MAVGADGLIHFEIRRSKDGGSGVHVPAGKVKRKLTEKKAVPEFDDFDKEMDLRFFFLVVIDSDSQLEDTDSERDMSSPRDAMT